MSKKEKLGELITENTENAEKLSDADIKVASDKDNIEKKISKLILENEQHAKELSTAYKIIATQEKEIKKQAEALIRADKEKVKRKADLISAKKELAHRAELIITNKELNQQITERKMAELELINAKEKAEESERLKSAFLTNMSHEIRTPMNGILGFTSLLKEPNLSGEELQEYISIIEKSGNRMLNTIGDLMNISMIESGQKNIEISDIKINKLTDQLFAFFEPEAKKKGMILKLNNTLSDEKATILTDKEKVYSILTNLIRNAIKFSKRGSIEFGYLKKAKYLEFFIKDTGIGIPKDRQEAIFDRFVQADIDDRDVYEGNGLGLSISKAYVEMLGGRIWVDSEEGLGSTFYFTIPYSAVSEEKIETISVDSAEHTEVQIKNLKILVVEDDEISYSLLLRTLQKISEEVLLATTGLEAIEACRNHSDLDLVLMDIRMPKMDGNEATRQIRKFNKEVIIIAQTAYAFAGDSEKAIEAGCNDYITKPINITLLNELIKKHCDK